MPCFPDLREEFPLSVKGKKPRRAAGMIIIDQKLFLNASSSFGEGFSSMFEDGIKNRPRGGY
jgi:hypothetical protein